MKTSKYQVVVWDVLSQDMPVMIHNFFCIDEEEKFSIRAQYEKEGYEVHSWGLTLEEIKTHKNT